MNEEPKKSIFKKWWFWVIGIIVIAGLVIFCLSYYQGHKNDREHANQQNSATQMTPEQLRAAETALAKGITVKDGKGDFITEFGSSPYWIPMFDIKEMSFGIDGKYFYRKCTYWETAPKTPPTINGVNAWNMNCSHEIFPDAKKDITTKFGQGLYHMLVTNYSYENSNLGIELYLDMPEGGLEEEVDYPGNPYNQKDREYGGLVYGAAGYDYVIAAWPLSVLNLKSGDGVIISVNTEVGAGKDKTHYANDPLPNKGHLKNEEKIKWTLGQDTFEIVNDNKRGL